MSEHASGAPMFELPAPWSHVTLQWLAEKIAQEAPARPFMADCPDRLAWNGVEPRKLNCGIFLRAASFLAAQLRALGVLPGDRVLVLLPNCVEHYLAVLACRLTGAVPAIAPIDESADYLRGCAERIKAAVIVTCGVVGDLALGKKARLVAARALCVRCIAGFGFDLVEGIVSLEGWSEEEVDPLPDRTCHQGEDALVTFSRDNAGPLAALRTEGQVIAEALALHCVLHLDGRRGLVSLMQPGASATLAATLPLAMHSGARVNLVGPYARDALIRTMTGEAAGAFLFAPDHFLASLAPTAYPPGFFDNAAGFLALARVEAPKAGLLRPGPFRGALALDFGERGLMTRSAWPINGQIDLPHRYDHPMGSVLPKHIPMLEWRETRLEGFGAARILSKALRRSAA